MEVDHGTDSEHKNYVLFTVTDVIEWYTESEDGSVSVEAFVSNEPVCPEDIPIGLEHANKVAEQ